MSPKNGKEAKTFETPTPDSEAPEAISSNKWVVASLLTAAAAGALLYYMKKKTN